ncbi:MAG: phosphoenolpyruvate--protein phosphotransferase [Alphaproteobacteria bacterium]|nr:phosphoenolpyruvate--protein phosphotransferase [Alphaproteobacteria bacterium]
MTDTETALAREITAELRALMAQELPVQDKLDRVVALIAERLRVDACACYILRPGSMLELYATKGLSPDAVHETFLRVGEGLIGEIALQRKPLAFANAWRHKSFVYKPETKEKAFKSLMGVPLVRENRLLGVLSVQTKKIKNFSADIVEVLETIAMVVSDMLASHPAISEQPDAFANNRRKITGIPLIEGFAQGMTLVHKRIENVAHIVDGNAKTEIKKLTQALAGVEREVNKMMALPKTNAEQVAIFETYLMFLKDKGWISKMTKIVESGLTAEAAVHRVGLDMSERMERMTDPYIRERIHDFQDLVNRLIRHLRGRKADADEKRRRQVILVAHSLGPAELLDYNLKYIKGIVLEEGSQTMHVVIVARSLNIPVICGIKDATHVIPPKTFAALDAISGQLYLNPSDEILDDLKSEMARRAIVGAHCNQSRALPAVTKDGVKIALNINAGLLDDLLVPEGTFYSGIGLYRTELPFMMSQELPGLEAQAETYHKVITKAGHRPVVFRTLDIGSDKVLPYFQQQGEENPAMGWRSIRITLDRRALLRDQLRAFIRASGEKPLAVMFPMVSATAEFLEAKKTFFLELEREKNAGRKVPKDIKIGTMLEVPSLLFQMDELLKHVDFVSIGTNDLMQFLFAADRGNALIWNRYDTLSPTFLRVLKSVNDACAQAGVPCSVCGEMAGHPLEAVVLVALGFTSLSLNPGKLGAVKAALRTMNQAETAAYVAIQMNASGPSIRDAVRAYAHDHGIFIT